MSTKKETNTKGTGWKDYSRNEKREYLFKETDDGKYYIYVIAEKEMRCVKEAVYLELRRSIWREEKQAERNAEHTLSLDYEYETECDGNAFTMADFLEQSLFTNPESEIVSNATANEMLSFIQEHCTDEEWKMFQAIFMARMTVQSYAAANGFPRTTVQSRKDRLQKKLQKIFKKFVI